MSVIWGNTSCNYVLFLLLSGKSGMLMGLFQVLRSFATWQRQWQEDDAVQGHLWQLAQIIFLQERMRSAFGILVRPVRHQKESWGKNLCHDYNRQCVVG